MREHDGEPSWGGEAELGVELSGGQLRLRQHVAHGHGQAALVPPVQSSANILISNIRDIVMHVRMIMNEWKLYLSPATIVSD